jgi:hypothetical protein
LSDAICNRATGAVQKSTGERCSVFTSASEASTLGFTACFGTVDANILRAALSL